MNLRPLPAHLLLLVCTFLLPACAPTPSVPESDKPKELTASKVPLRVWIAAPVRDKTMIQRQWQGGSDQEVEIRQVSPADLLSPEIPNCDVLVFPSRMLSDLIARESIQKVNPTLFEHASSQDESSAGFRAAELTQVLHDGERFAMPLGCAIPLVIASPTLASQLPEEPTWAQLVEKLPSVDHSQQMELTEDEIDREALVDRFLAISSSFVVRNPTYGLLFEMQSMQPRLTAPEFVEAAKMLQKLYQQPGGSAALLGSHSYAWTWASENQSPAAAISIPGQISQEAAELVEGKPIRIQSEMLVGWNTGGGLVASICSNCQQTAHSLKFIQWLRESTTRNALAPFVMGIAPVRSNADQLSFNARNLLKPAYESDSLPQEPSLPLAMRYRRALATQLLSMLQDNVAPEKALNAANQSWLEITREAGPEQRRWYEKSLGLTF